MLDDLAAVLRADARIAYALVFGSVATGAAHPHSDVDVAIGVRSSARLGVTDLGDLASKLEEAAGRQVDLVLLDEAPPGLAYRIFRDGLVITSLDEVALKARRARAILEYLDFCPIEDLCTKGVLAATHGR
jgi:predicted nucleotidyltransferase